MNPVLLSLAFTGLPYYAWANCGKGKMTVWFPQQLTDVELIPRQPKEVTVGK